MGHPIHLIIKFLFCWGHPLVIICKLHKYLHVFCPFEKVYIHTSPNFLVTNFPLIFLPCFCISSQTIDFKQMDSQIFLQQKRFIWEKQRIAIQVMRCNSKLCASPEKHRRGMLFYNLQRSYCKWSLLEETSSHLEAPSQTWLTKYLDTLCPSELDT